MNHCDTAPDLEVTGGGEATLKLGGWIPHLVLVALACAMIGVAKARHLSTEDALAVAFDESADSDSRIWAMHVAANRASEKDPRLGVDLARTFLQSDSDRVREAALMVDLCRHAIPEQDAKEHEQTPIQDAYAYGDLPGGVWAPHRIRSLVLHRRKVGGPPVGSVRRMQLPEARWFLDSLAGKPSPTAKEVSQYFKMRIREAAALNAPAAKSDD